MSCRSGRCLAAIGSTVALSGCDPVLNIYGSFFPAWVVSLVVGVLLTVVLRLVLAALRLEREMGPLVLVYPSLGFLLTCATWLILFRS
jgi:hypothetical protein